MWLFVLANLPNVCVHSDLVQLLATDDSDLTDVSSYVMGNRLMCFLCVNM